jgi:hypothetical protein
MVRKVVAAAFRGEQPDCDACAERTARAMPNARAAQDDDGGRCKNSPGFAQLFQCDARRDETPSTLAVARSSGSRRTPIGGRFLRLAVSSQRGRALPCSTQRADRSLV